MSLSLLAILSKWICPDFITLAKNSGTIQLITISYSHFCEISSWALRKSGKKFTEYGYSPVQHAFPAIRVRIGNSKVKHLSDSSTCHIEMVDEKTKKYKGKATSVPVAVCPDGTILTDSWEIATYSGLTDVDPDFKKFLDEEFGPTIRSMLYHQRFKPQNIYLFTKLCTFNRHWIWKLLWWLFVGDFCIKLLSNTFKTKDKNYYEENRKNLEIMLSKIDKKMDDMKGSYLSGHETPGVADIAVASLFAQLVHPPMYSEGKYTEIFDELVRTDLEVKAEVQFWSNTRVGQFTLDLYKNHRMS